jgi:DNA-binding Lrp family transcriptional regulator
MVDDKDKLILAELKKNARDSTKNIASNVKIPRITVRDRIQKMVDSKIIKSFTVIIDHEKLGFAITVFIFVASNPCESNVSIEDIANKIAKFSGVFEIHILSGEYDLLIKARGKTFDDIGKHVIAKIRKIPGVGRTYSVPCFTTIKEEV